MKLKDWFTELSEQGLSKKEKASMYARILQGTEEKHFFTKRMEFYLRVGTLTTLLIGAGVYFFTGYMPQHLNTTISDNPVVTVNNVNNNVVQADTIGKLINVEGSIEIFNGDEKIEHMDGLVSGNTVHLQNGARVELVVRQGVKAIITGPAVFSLERLEQDGNSTLILNLIEGSYFEIVPVQTAEKEVFERFEEQEEEEQEKETLVVKTQDFEIQQMPAQRDLRVKVTKDEEGVARLENQGSDVIVKRLGGEDSKKLTVVGHNQVAMLEHDIIRLDEDINQGESDQIEQQLRDKQLTIRYESDSDITVPDSESDTGASDTDADVSSTSALTADSTSQTTDSTSQTEDSDDEIMTPDSNTVTKRVLEKSATEELQKVIAIGFVKKHSRDIAVYHAAGIEDKKSVALESLASIVNRARNLLDLQSVDVSIEGVYNGFNELYTHLNNNYYVGPSLDNLLKQNKTLIQTMYNVPADIQENDEEFSYDAVVEVLAEEGYTF